MILLGIGVVLGIVLCALIAILIAFGVVSSSVAIAFINRSPASGLRALFLQVGAIAGVLCGIGTAWVITWLGKSHGNISTRILVGGGSGLVCGIVLAWLFNFSWGKLASWIVSRFEGKKRETNAIDV